MFDPSKIDLDLDSSPKKDNENNIESEPIKKEIIPEKKADILNDGSTQNEDDRKIDEPSKEDNKEIIKSEEEVEDSEVLDENLEITSPEPKIIFDININSLEYIIKYLISKQYDFFTLEPEENKIKVSFKKDNLEKESKYIKYPTYSSIILKAKSLTKLKIEDVENNQEGTCEINLNKKIYKALSKTVPSNFWEKLFFKIIETEKKVAPKKKEKMSFSKMISIFSGLLFTAILIWGIFISIVLFNSNSVSDLQFFNNLWVDTNAIKEFAAKIVNWIFGITLLIEIIFLFVFSYKALLTKKELKQKKISRIIISIFFLLLSVITFITWMFLAQKINSLKWLNYWKIEFYDNSKYLSNLFEKKWAKINISEKIIGPITIRFNNEEFIKKLNDDWFNPNKVTWQIWEENREIAVEDYELTHTFKEKWLTEIKLIIEWTNIKWEADKIEKDIWKINISNIVKINEIKLDNGWSKFIFDALDLKELWKIKWYYIPSLKWKTNEEENNIITKALSKEKLEWYKFNSKNIFQWEEYYWIKIISSGKEKEGLDKLFIISKWDNNEIFWKIEQEVDQNNPNKYEFKFKEPETNVGGSYIKEYIWKIKDFDDKGEKKEIVFKKEANLSDLENSSKINYTFKNAWEHEINLVIVDSEWKQQTFSSTININKSLVLLTKLNFKIWSNELEYKKDIIYEKNNNTYYLENIPAPSSIEIDANKIRALNPRYWLEEVSYDLDNDWNFEKIGKKAIYDINKDWVSSFRIKYSFVNKNVKTEIIDVIETIHITSINKESILDLQIIKPTSYVPVIVKFDASGSRVNWKDIEKFIFHYWDWTESEERDSKNNGHKYIKAWDYDVKLEVVTSDWEKYSITKKLILKNKPQKAVIKTSLKKAPLYQTIDFSAEDSIWEVWKYLWDFWDSKTSTKISPSHFYDKPWKYKIKLNLEFTNKNVLEDEIEIEIYEE